MNIDDMTRPAFPTETSDGMSLRDWRSWALTETGRCGNIIAMTTPSIACRTCPSVDVTVDANELCEDCAKAFAEWQADNPEEYPGCYQCWKATGETVPMNQCQHAVDNWDHLGLPGI